MPQPVGTVGKGLLAVPACEWPLAGMHPLVVDQFGLYAECLLADVTLERQFALVLQHVSLQVVPLHVRLAADVAHELPGGRVPFDVRLQLVTVIKRLVALVAFVLFLLPNMFRFVSLALACHGKLHPANRANVPLGHVESLLMLFQSLLVDEPSVANSALNRSSRICVQHGLHTICLVFHFRVGQQFFLGIENLIAALSAANFTSIQGIVRKCGDDGRTLGSYRRMFVGMLLTLLRRSDSCAAEPAVEYSCDRSSFFAMRLQSDLG